MKETVDDLLKKTSIKLAQLMENAAEQVRETNRESDEKFFAELRRASEEAKKRGTTSTYSL